MAESNEKINLFALSLDQLNQLKQSIEEELQGLNGAIQQLQVSRNKLTTSKEALNRLAKTPEGTQQLVPITSSLYVPGETTSLDNVLVDVGTGAPSSACRNTLCPTLSTRNASAVIPHPPTSPFVHVRAIADAPARMYICRLFHRKVAHGGAGLSRAQDGAYRIAGAERAGRGAVQAAKPAGDGRRDESQNHGDAERRWQQQRRHRRLRLAVALLATGVARRCLFLPLSGPGGANKAPPPRSFAFVLSPPLALRPASCEIARAPATCEVRGGHTMRGIPPANCDV